MSKGVLKERADWMQMMRLMLMHFFNASWMMSTLRMLPHMYLMYSQECNSLRVKTSHLRISPHTETMHKQECRSFVTKLSDRLRGLVETWRKPVNHAGFVILPNRRARSGRRTR